MNDDDLITHLAVGNFDPPAEEQPGPNGRAGWLVAVVLLIVAVLVAILV